MSHEHGSANVVRVMAAASTGKPLLFHVRSLSFRLQLITENHIFWTQCKFRIRKFTIDYRYARSEFNIFLPSDITFTGNRDDVISGWKKPAYNLRKYMRDTRKVTAADQ